MRISGLSIPEYFLIFKTVITMDKCLIAFVRLCGSTMATMQLHCHVCCIIMCMRKPSSQADSLT